jgi:hypothetical protein
VTTVDLRVQHNSMQFSDTRAQQMFDAEAVFDLARKRSTLFVTGTEGGGDGVSDALTKQSKAFGFVLNLHKTGDWVAVNTQLARVVASGFEGPYIRGTTGLKASQGAHSPRGIVWATAKFGKLTATMGSVHYLTQRSTAVSGSNAPLVDGIAAFGADKGKGRQLVFINGDMNLDDEKQDVFRGQPFTSCWDELKKYPATYGETKLRGRTIDISASYNADGRVSCKSARVLDDKDLKLFTDHFVIEATYSVRL